MTKLDSVLRHGCVTMGLAGLLGLAACSDDPPTFGDTCSRLGSATCDRAIQCNLGPASDRQGCLSAFQQECCSSAGLCGQKIDKNQEAALDQYVRDCSAAISSLSCSDLEENNLPSVCTDAEYTSPVSKGPFDWAHAVSSRL